MEQFELDLRDPFVRRDPYPHLARLREAAPVVRSRSLGQGNVLAGADASYVVHRFDDVRRAFVDHRHLSSSRLLGPATGPAGPDGGEGASFLQTLMADPEIRELFEDPEFQANIRVGVFGGTNMLSADGAEHERLRSVANQAFLPRQVSSLEARIRELTQDLVRPFADRSRSHELMETLAGPLPSMVVAELLGIPPEDHTRFSAWSGAVVGSVESDGSRRVRRIRRGRREGLPPQPEAPDRGRRVPVLPGRSDRPDRVEPADNLIGRLVEANRDDVLSADELMGSIFLLLVAGNETTTRLIANLVLALHRHPAERALLADDPGLVPGAVEEALRYDSPVQAIARVALAPMAIAGVPVAEGSLVTLLVGAANRDPAVSPRPIASTCAVPTPRTSRSAPGCTSAGRAPGPAGGPDRPGGAAQGGP